MKKVVDNKTIYFYNDEDYEIMNMDHSIDECTWYFYSDDVILVTPDMELFDRLDVFMNQDYMFPNSVLLNYKDKNRLVWYSDCYYNPDDEWSIESVSCLNIEKIDDYNYIVSGLMTLNDVNNYLDIKLESEVADTIAGLFIEKLGEIPSSTKNCEVKIGNLKLKLLKLDDKRLDSIQLIIDNHIQKEAVLDEDNYN